MCSRACKLLKFFLKLRMFNERIEKGKPILLRKYFVCPSWRVVDSCSGSKKSSNEQLIKNLLSTCASKGPQSGINQLRDLERDLLPVQVRYMKCRVILLIEKHKMIWHQCGHQCYSVVIIKTSWQYDCHIGLAFMTRFNT